MIILRNKTYSHEEEIANIAAVPEAAEEAIETEAREAGDSNLDSRNDALKTLNDFLGNIH